MEVKGILDKIRQQEEEKKEYYFALEIGIGVVKSAVWLVEKGKIKIVAIGASESWEEEEKLLNAVDATLSSAAENFTPQEEIAEPNKVIFGLPADWIEEEKITPEKLKILKHLSQKLELEPVGFVVTSEAITHYLKATEGVPPTAILISLSKTKVSLTLLRLGKISPTQVVERSQNLGDDVIEGLSRYGEKEPFPSRILLYNSTDELEEAGQNLVNYAWQEEKVKEKEVTFLHLPKIEILSSDFDIKAVALAGGKEVARAAGIMADFVEKKEKPAPAEIKEPEIKEKKEEALATVDFGFVKGKDILEEKKPIKEESTVEEKIEEKKVGPEKIEEEKVARKPLPEAKEVVSRLKRIPLPSLNLSRLKKIDFSRFFAFFSGLRAKISFEDRGPFIIGIVLAILFVLGGIVIALYWYMPKASVVLLVEPKVLEEEFEIRLDPSLTIPDKEKLALPAQEIETVLEGEETVSATGTKLTGEKTKGEVTIYNGTSNKKTFSAETTITSSSGVEFTLDDEVSVASQSGTAAEPVPGKATVEVTAIEIGTEGNLAAGTEFAVANYSQSDYVAKNESAFSGGTSREIQVVTEEDHEELLSSLTEELEAQSIDQLKTKVSSERNLLEESLESSIVSKSFSKKIDEEATEVGLSLKLKFIAFTYSEDEMRNLIEEVVKDEIPADFEFRQEESKIEFDLKELAEEEIAAFTVRLQANLVPEFDLEKIKKNLVGKYPLFGKTYLENLPNVVGAEIKIRPPLPARLLTFPRIAKNINIEVRVQ